MTGQTVDEFLKDAIERHKRKERKQPPHYLYIEITDEGLGELADDIKDIKTTAE